MAKPDLRQLVTSDASDESLATEFKFQQIQIPVVLVVTGNNRVVQLMCLPSRRLYAMSMPTPTIHKLDH